MTVFRDDEGNERIQPSDRAIKARDAWLKAHPNYKGIMREQLTGSANRTDAELDAMVERWTRITGAESVPPGMRHIVGAHRAELRRARRWLRLVNTCAFLSIGTAIALIVYYARLGHH